MKILDKCRCDLKAFASLIDSEPNPITKEALQSSKLAYLLKNNVAKYERLSMLKNKKNRFKS